MADILPISGLQPRHSVTAEDCIPGALFKTLPMSFELHFSAINTKFLNRNTLYILELE